MVDRASDKLSPPSFQKEYEDPWNKLTIDLEALKFNYHYIKDQLPPGAVFYAVLKSDAYGHGIVEVGKILSDLGCVHFAVESPQEGIRLRDEGIAGEILLMNPIPVWMSEIAVRHDLSVSVIRPSILAPLDEAAEKMGKVCRIHLHVNIGLNRLGIQPEAILNIAREANARQNLEMEGLFGQPRDLKSAVDSYRELQKLYEILNSEEVAPNYLHFANSTTFLEYPEVIGDGVRIGILLYGILPPEQFRLNHSNPLQPVMSLETELVQIQHLPKGSKLGYRSEETIERDTTIGTIPLGYYHGLDRRMSDISSVILHQSRIPYIGPISMNSSTIDITDIADARIGDKVTVIGRQGDQEIRINELGEDSDTIAAEIMMRLGQSMPRQFQSADPETSTEIFFEQDRSEDISVRYFQTENELPENINVHDVVHFLQNQLIPYDDPNTIISRSVEYALSSHPGGRGFVLLATLDETILGVLVNIKLDRIGIIPENMIVYVCVHREYRKRGLGSRLIREAIECTEGNVKIHVDKTNPAAKLCRKLGFRDNFMEMRFLKDWS